MKVAIIGLGLSGLTCAIELEKKGIIADIYEKDNNVGWAWSEVGYWPNIIYNEIGDPRKYLKENYEIDIKPVSTCRTNILKSANKEVKIEGNLGYIIPRGKGNESVENQLLVQLRKTPIQYNTPADYKELSKKYDYVVVATGRDQEARELNIWEDLGLVRIIQGIAIGNFDPDSATMYMNTDYAGTGYARLTPFNSIQALLSLYVMGRMEYEAETLFNKFLQVEQLGDLEILYKTILPPHYNGRVKKFKVDNILFTGRSAGLVECLVGTGGVEALISGVLAARAIANNEDYEASMKPIQKHIDNISSFRKELNKYTNDDFDKLLSFIGTPGIKQTLYNSKINFADLFGGILKAYQKNH